MVPIRKWNFMRKIGGKQIFWNNWNGNRKSYPLGPPSPPILPRRYFDIDFHRLGFVIGEHFTLVISIFLMVFDNIWQIRFSQAEIFCENSSQADLIAFINIITVWKIFMCIAERSVLTFSSREVAFRWAYIGDFTV